MTAVMRTTSHTGGWPHGTGRSTVITCVGAGAGGATTGGGGGGSRSAPQRTHAVHVGWLPSPHAGHASDPCCVVPTTPGARKWASRDSSSLAPEDTLVPAQNSGWS